MRAVDVIRKKRDGGELTPAEIDAFVTGAARGTWPDYQLSALLMAICTRGMTDAETAHLTRAMADSGSKLDLSDVPGVKIDKHSTGGVGDKVSLVAVPLAAACGVIVPKMSGRGLGHTGGTVDKLESIPGFRVNLSIDEVKSALRDVGAVLIGQSGDIAPADKKLYALRDVTGTVESIPLITASILSKKLAEGISGLVLDVKCGRGAFMKTLPEARALAESLVRVGKANGLAVEVVISNMDAPLGRAVGNGLEVLEAVETLKARGPKDLEDLSVLLAAKMVRMAGLAINEPEAETKIRRALAAGAGLARFSHIIERQGGNPKVIDDGYWHEWVRATEAARAVRAPRSGFLTRIDAERVGQAAMQLGAGRQRAEDTVDYHVGIEVVHPIGTAIEARSDLALIGYRNEKSLETALPLLESAFEIGDMPPSPTPLILETLP